MAEGLDFLIPSLLFMKGALIDNQRSSNKFAASGNRSALCLPGSFRRRGFQPTICASNEPSGHTCMSIWRLPQQPANLFAGSWRPAYAAGRTLRGALRADLLMPQEALLRRGRSCKCCISTSIAVPCVYRIIAVHASNRCNACFII